MFSTRYFEYEGRRFKNHNSLLAGYPGADGMKTGYTRASGFNLVASATRQGRRVIGVIFGAKSAPRRDAHMRRLLDRAFAKLNLKKPSTKNIAGAPKKKSKPAPKSDVAMGIARALHKPSKVATQSTGAKNPKDPDWAIQVGAFTERGPARLAATKAARELPIMRKMTQVVVVPAQIGNEMIYRARLVGLSKRNATEACRRLELKKVKCVPVPPGINAP
jgi:D-alanyl-D-alanine carboxypeptidase